jgi:hypothetical protein
MHQVVLREQKILDPGKGERTGGSTTLEEVSATEKNPVAHPDEKEVRGGEKARVLRAASPPSA